MTPPATNPSAPPTFIDSAEVARLLELPDGTAFLRQRIALEDNHGFPVPVPHWHRPLKYRRDQVLAWIEAQGRPRAARDDIDPSLIAAGKVLVLAEARRP